MNGPHKAIFLKGAGVVCEFCSLAAPFPVGCKSNPLPATASSSREDPAMKMYVKALFEATELKSNLDLGATRLVGNTTKLEGPSVLFVRACYLPLAEALFNARQKGRNAVVTGIPGTGKTAFRNYVSHYFLQKMKDPKSPAYKIVLHGSGEAAAECTVLSVTSVDGKLQFNAQR